MPLAVPEPIDRGRRPALAQARFPGGRDGRAGGQLAGPRLWHKGCQPGAFCFAGQGGPLPLPPARGGNGRGTVAVRGGHTGMARWCGHADMAGEDTGGLGIDQGMPHHHPAADTPERLGVCEPGVNLCFLQMRGGLGNSWPGVLRSD